MTPLSEAEGKFDALIAAAAVSTAASPTCAADCESPDFAGAGGPVVGKDLVAAINDTTGTTGVGILHQEAVSDDAPLPPQTPPQIPGLDAILGASTPGSFERARPMK